MNSAVLNGGLNSHAMKGPTLIIPYQLRRTSHHKHLAALKLRPVQTRGIYMCVCLLLLCYCSFGNMIRRKCSRVRYFIISRPRASRNSARRAAGFRTRDLRITIDPCSNWATRSGRIEEWKLWTIYWMS
jgi:hypothetical protein